jgi:hypothetical protein
MRVDRVIERSECGAQAWWGLRAETEVKGLESRSDDACVDLGQE